MPRALAQVLEEKFGTKGIPLVNRLGVVSIGVTAVRIYSNEPNRLGLIFVNLSANSIVGHFDNTVTLTKGILSGPNGGGFALFWDEDFELTASEFYFVASGAASAYLAYEIISAGA